MLVLILTALQTSNTIHEASSGSVSRVKLSLCLTKHHTMTTYMRMEVQLHAFLTSALGGGEYRSFMKQLDCGRERGISPRRDPQFYSRENETGKNLHTQQLQGHGIWSQGERVRVAVDVSDSHSGFTHLNAIFPSLFRSSVWPPSKHNRATCPAHRNLLNFTQRLALIVQIIRKPLNSVCRCRAPFYFTSAPKENPV
jgi:hypothetical protein